MMRPFRLVNSFEMEKLIQYFSPAIQYWNDKYALTPFSFHIEAPKKNHTIKNGSHIINDNQCFAIIEEHNSGILNLILFGENNTCYNSVSQDLLLILLNSLFKVEQCSIEKTTNPVPDWIYKGSTCLVLILNSGKNNLNIILNPDWVYRSFLSNPIINDKLDSLEEALAEQVLTLNLELLPMSLPINQLINIQIGDVIATDHPISSPLKVLQKEHLLAEAELGQSKYYKSIVIKESL